MFVFLHVSSLRNNPHSAAYHVGGYNLIAMKLRVNFSSGMSYWASFGDMKRKMQGTDAVFPFSSLPYSASFTTGQIYNAPQNANEKVPVRDYDILCTELP